MAEPTDPAKMDVALDIFEALIKLAPELVDLIDRWLTGDTTSADADPIYAKVRERLDAAMLRLDNEIESLEKLKK